MAAPPGGFEPQEVQGPLEYSLIRVTAAAGDSMFPTVSTRDLVERGFLSTHPVAARERITQRYICELSLSGRECDGIALLRELIQQLDCGLKFARCLFITAPHTHWGDETIVESFDPNRNVYLAGPLSSYGNLQPFSFVFSPDGPVPYEWADESVRVDQSALKEVYSFILDLNNLVSSRLERELPIPLGIMIDHRFKRSIWDEQLFTFAEGPHSEEGGRAIIRPIFQSVLRPNQRYPDQVQVAWSAFPNSEFVEPYFSTGEVTILDALESILDGLQPDQALDFIESLESHLRATPKKNPKE